MKKFLISSLVILLSFLATVLIIYNFPTGSIDNFYRRFTTEKKPSLILGSSRSAHGIVPEELNRIIKGNFFFNYSFSINQSPFGSTYFESIKKKLDTSSVDEPIFIISVDPWSISSECSDPNDSSSFRELKGSLAKVNNVNANPNYEYLLRCLDERNIKLILKSPITYLHNDGWLEVNANMNEEYLRKNIQDKIKIYSDRLAKYKYSDVRYEWLIRIIRYLKNRGDVYLLRLPVHPKMKAIDDQLMPDFNEKMIEIASKEFVEYINLMPLNEQFQYTDGNHLYKESSRQVSKIIVNRINLCK